jgi:hypothetical protein
MKASAPQQCFGWKSKDGPPQVRQQIGALLTMMVAAASAHESSCPDVLAFAVFYF